MYCVWPRLARVHATANIHYDGGRRRGHGWQAYMLPQIYTVAGRDEPAARLARSPQSPLTSRAGLLQHPRHKGARWDTVVWVALAPSVAVGIGLTKPSGLDPFEEGRRLEHSDAVLPGERAGDQIDPVVEATHDGRVVWPRPVMLSGDLHRTPEHTHSRGHRRRRKEAKQRGRLIHIVVDPVLWDDRSFGYLIRESSWIVCV